MASRRIYYLAKNFAYPLGGVRIIHHHVDLLVKNGYDAVVLLRQDEAQHFFRSQVPTMVAGRNMSITASDIFVVPEPWNDILRGLASSPARRIVFCQNHFYVPNGIARATDYAAFGVSTILSCGDVIASALRDIFGLKHVPVVHNAIDHTLFKPGAKRLQIAYMPRKMRKESDYIRMSFKRRHPRFHAVPWVPIEMIQEAEVARILGESAIFLSLSHLEGVGLPPLEAMASGCLVVGFGGGGGLEYATPQNGFWCRQDDLSGCADALARACTLAHDDREAHAVRVAAGRSTAGRYTLQRMERELLDFWRTELAQ
ncbi:MAG: glycosyltransferase family 4 protein [Planctomycetes bacterium]|nr:glycosyltransferase family 4 protein [Planctomycetota bacterium]